MLRQLKRTKYSYSIYIDTQGVTRIQESLDAEAGFQINAFWSPAIPTSASYEHGAKLLRERLK